MSTRNLMHRLRYFVGDARDELRYSRGVNLIAIGTLGSTLFLAALPVLFLANIERHVRRLQSDVRVEIYLRDEISDGQREELLRIAEAGEGVERVEYVSKDEALARYRAWAGHREGLIDEVGGNPLPASIEAVLHADPDVERLGNALVLALRDVAGVEDIGFDRNWLRRLEDWIDTARIGGAILAIPVLIAVIFVMGAVLRLIVYARREEIEIVTLVGATRSFVWGPFLVAALGQAFVAAALALGATEMARTAIETYASARSLTLLQYLVEHPLPVGSSVAIAAVGLLVGIAGSWLAVRLTLGPVSS